MAKLITLKIDVTKIHREALFKGAKGTYLDCSFFLNDDADEYGNHGCIRQDLGKESRAAGEKGPILGNAKLKIIGDKGWGPNTGSASQGQALQMNDQARQAQQAHRPSSIPSDDSIPY